VVAALLALLQCVLSSVLAYRLYLLSQTYKGVDPHRRTTAVKFMKAHRIFIFIMTVLQCIRCVDPFTALGIWPYDLVRFLQLVITMTLYFQYSCTTYIVMDTLYACALKRTPGWLAIVVCILPVSELVVGFAMLICSYLVAQQWIGAIIGFYVVLMLTVNLTTYNVSGIYLIRILREHQKTGTSATPTEDISGSKSASPFDIVIAKTMRSMAMLTIPSLATLLMFLVQAVTQCNTRPTPVFDSANPAWGLLATLFVHIILGLVFTRIGWITKTALDSQIIGKAMSTPSTGSTGSSEGSPPEQKRMGRGLTRAEMKERVTRMSQSPTSRSSHTAAQNSRPDVEMREITPPVVAVTVVDSESTQKLAVSNETEIVVV
jgi:hypothetical protein